jgi:hypothetical protein
MPNNTYIVGGFTPENQIVWDGGRFVLIQPLNASPLSRPISPPTAALAPWRSRNFTYFNPTALTPTSKITQANPIGSPLSKVLGVLEELVGAVGLKVPESTRTKFPLRFA